MYIYITAYVCGSIAVHQRICAKAERGGRKRGVFNSARQRLRGNPSPTHAGLANHQCEIPP